MPGVDDFQSRLEARLAVVRNKPHWTQEESHHAVADAPASAFSRACSALDRVDHSSTIDIAGVLFGAELAIVTASGG